MEPVSYSKKLLLGDLRGALVSSLVALPFSLPLGALAFAPLGPEYLSVGVVAGLLSSIITNGISALAGGNVLQISGPRASTTLIMAGLLTALLSQGAGREQALVLALLCLFLSGILQISFGLVRLGSAARYVPYPVFAGFVNGVGLAVILGQLAASLGMPATISWTDLARHVDAIQLGACLVTLTTIVAMIVLPRVTTKIPPIIGALAIGTGAHHLLRLVWGDGRMGAVVLLPPAELPSLGVVSQMLDLTGADLRILGAVLPAVFILAAVGSLESVMSSAAIDAKTGNRSNANRELWGQGLANCVGACFGAAPSTGSPNRGLASFQSGGCTRVAAFLHSVALFCLFMWGVGCLALLPYAALAGIMIMVGWAMIDGASLRLARLHGGSFLGDCATMVLVAGLSILVNLAFAVFVGLFITIILFLVKMSRPIVQQWRDRTMVRSRNVRSLAEEAILAGRREDIAIVSLDGPLFFATTARLREDIEQGRAAARTLVLDLRRVRDIDVSGARMLRQIQQDLRKDKCDLLLAGLPADDPRSLYLAQAGILQDFAPDRFVETIDHAIELAEDSILGGHVEPTDFSLRDFGILRGLDETALDQVRSRLETCDFAPGTQIFRAGDTGDGVHLITRGMVDVVIDGPGARSLLRLATFKPGTIFGEMALLTKQPRSATAMARTEVGTLFISNDAFEMLAKNEPAISNRLLMNLGTELAERLRLTNAALQAQI